MGTSNQNAPIELPIYKNLAFSFEERARDLVSRMTLKEKISQIRVDAPAIRRLGIPAYFWAGECLHGIGMSVGSVTVFPQAIGLAATFNEELIFQVATIISDEARAKHHEDLRNGKYKRAALGVFSLLFGGYPSGLTFFSPNINIFRDPRWGRGQETYGEDPYLTARIAMAFVKGLQGNHPKYLKVVSTPKHFAAYNGPDKGRQNFDAIVSIKDLRETYLYAFKECVKEAKAASIMGAYNKLNGIPCCSNKFLLQDLLRDEWGFDGYVVSDFGATLFNRFTHRYFGSIARSAAHAIKSGCDLNNGFANRFLNRAVKWGFISEEEIDPAVIRVMKSRFQLGMFDPPEEVPYASIPYEVVDCEKHRKIALRTARESIVLLKNQDDFLPLDKNIKSIAVIGPNAHSNKVLLGNYSGKPSKSVTALEGIRNKVSPSTQILYTKGCKVKRRIFRGFSKALKAAKKADTVIMCMGINTSLESEDLAIITPNSDRLSIALPPHQQKLLELVYATGKPIVLVLLSGSCLAVPWADEHIPAILEVWYPGEEGGTAVADVIFGDYSPAGRLPVTFYKSTEDLPPITDCSMKRRTYRYIETEPLYPFGYGLSYTKFKYTNLQLSANNIKVGDELAINVDVENIGDCTSDEVVQLYLKDLEASVIVPHYQLSGFARITLKPTEKKTVSFTITARQMALISEEGKYIIEPGKFKVFMGGCQPDTRSKALMGDIVLEDEFEVTGNSKEIEY